MCKSKTNSSDQKYFSSKTKCCTFKPIIPNYLIGGIIQDSTQHPDILNWVNQNRQTFPLGIFPTKDDFITYDDILPDKFGRMDSFVCDFYHDGLCGIWKYRSAICSTYHCHFYKGFYGQQFWEDVRDFLQLIEERIAQYCCYELGISARYLKQNTTNFFINFQSAKWPLSNDEQLPLDDIWGDWVDKQADFFRECTKITQQLTYDDLIALDPIKVKIQLSALSESYEKMMSNSLPAELIINPKCNIIPYNNDYVFVQIDRMLKVPTIVGKLLESLRKQQPVNAIIKLAYQQFNVDVDVAYLRHMYEQKILIDASS